MLLKNFARALSVLFIAGPLFAIAAPGCSGDSGGGQGGGDSGGGAGSSGSNTTSGNTCANTCSDPGECESLACACNDGTTVNTTSCDNGCCATEDDACPDSCSDHGGWGSSSGSNSTGTGSNPGGAEVGEDCSSNADCASGICFYVDPDDENVQKCTKECSFGGGECDDVGWECAEISNGGDTKYLCVM